MSITVDNYLSAYGDGSKAFRCTRPGLWICEPGDATWYTACTYLPGGAVLVFVGTSPADYGGIVDDGDKTRAYGSALTNPHTYEVCKFIADVLIADVLCGKPVETEPECLAERRRIYAAKEAS